MITPNKTAVSGGELQASELMLGNYYMYLHEEHESFHQVTPDFIETQLLYNNDPDNDCFSRGWWARPIPLSPDILEKCGFEWETEKKTHLQLTLPEGNIVNPTYISFYFIGEVMDEFQIYMQDYESGFYAMKPPKYLHQLQNIYFCLTGEHLKIDLA